MDSRQEIVFVLIGGQKSSNWEISSREHLFEWEICKHMF
ncbi:MAG: hypothetical protein Hyperionvirus6_34 [Hyperionvirus sp.]|uniref:Uncharacterized protein n=1 Tax=Hyperionvirus sp. TaxID=2487770 RepID=A0A3G5ABU4_9VIRU|nr:MAG: hypothetical protein Hyperionvirus6_34 [Hyperionvirus sp.]